MLVELVKILTRLFEQVVSTLGIPGIGLLALIENLIPPMPIDLLFPLGGKLAYDGKLDLILVMVAGIVGTVIGALVYYELGRRMGEERTRQFIANCGQITVLNVRITLVSVEQFNYALDLFQRHGGVIVMAARVLPYLHGLISIPAGIFRMNLATYVIYTTFGAALRVVPLTLLGFWLGSRWDRVLHWLDVFDSAATALLALLITALVGRYIYHRYRSGGAAQVRELPET